MVSPDPDSMGLGPAGDELETNCPHDGEGTCTCTAIFFNVNEPYPQLRYNEKRRLYGETVLNTESHWRD